MKAEVKRILKHEGNLAIYVDIVDDSGSVVDHKYYYIADKEELLQEVLQSLDNELENYTPPVRRRVEPVDVKDEVLQKVLPKLNVKNVKVKNTDAPKSGPNV